MNKSLSLAEITAAMPVMTKRDKLLRFAAAIRAATDHIHMLNSVEFMTERDMAQTQCQLFDIASHDPVLQDAGLTGNTVLEGKRFFGLTQNELHHLSCDCGGALTNSEMARRVENIAAVSA